MPVLDKLQIKLMNCYVMPFILEPILRDLELFILLALRQKGECFNQFWLIPKGLNIYNNDSLLRFDPIGVVLNIYTML